MKIEKFFSLKNSVNVITEEDKVKTTNYIAVVDSFSRVTSKSIFLIDYQSKGFEYVSPNPLFLNGHTVDEVIEMGYEFYFKYVPPEDLELLFKVNAVGFAYYETIPLCDRKKYSISYDFHLIAEGGRRVLIRQKLTPIFLNQEGKVWKSICIVSLSPEQDSGNIILESDELNVHRYYDLEVDCWKDLEKINLTKREAEVLHFSMRGFCITDIADMLFVSKDTVKFHRRKLFQKLDATNITDAIMNAANRGLI